MGAVSEIVQQLQEAAGPGQVRLDGPTTDRLRAVTRQLIDAKPEAAAELARFRDARQRGLTLPEPTLTARLGGATVLVTGGTGCIGSTLMRQLAIRRPGRLISVSRGLTDGWPRLDNVEYRQADICDRASLNALVAELRPNVIFHVAAQRDPGLAEIETHRTISTNLLGTINVLRVAARLGVPQVVCASMGKALSPCSTETYAATNRAAEWAMATAVAETGLLCSAARFTHVVDNSIIYQRLRSLADGNADGTSTGVIRLHSTDIAFYTQSALEAAHLLLTAFAGAVPGELRLYALNNLDVPVQLLDLALGVLGESGSSTPIYISGHDAGYEGAPIPGLYEQQPGGGASPLLNPVEAASRTESPSPMADAFRLGFATDPRLFPAMRALETELGRTANPNRLRMALSALSWPLLDAALAVAPSCALARTAAQAAQHWDIMPNMHSRILAAIRVAVTRAGRRNAIVAA